MSAMPTKRNRVQSIEQASQGQRFPFESDKMRHSTDNQFLRIKGYRLIEDTRWTHQITKNTAAESPEINVAKKKKSLKRSEDRTHITLRKSEVRTKN